MGANTAMHRELEFSLYKVLQMVPENAEQLLLLADIHITSEVSLLFRGKLIVFVYL